MVFMISSEHRVGIKSNNNLITILPLSTVIVFTIIEVNAIYSNNSNRVCPASTYTIWYTTTCNLMDDLLGRKTRSNKLYTVTL